ncbi:MAG: hypothetical protein FWE03_01840 [Firmicutes bacterium]|nr:hypothetical protein [Bacillota bacterium]
MKDTKVCPKCNNNSIITIGSHYTNPMIRIPFGILNSAIIKPYICSKCGYTEFYVDNQKDLEKLKTKYENKNLIN